jgi:hypothetical protein
VPLGLKKRKTGQWEHVKNVPTLLLTTLHMLTCALTMEMAQVMASILLERINAYCSLMSAAMVNARCQMEDSSVNAQTDLRVIKMDAIVQILMNVLSVPTSVELVNAATLMEISFATVKTVIQMDQQKNA